MRIAPIRSSGSGSFISVCFSFAISSGSSSSSGSRSMSALRSSAARWSAVRVGISRLFGSILPTTLFWRWAASSRSWPSRSSTRELRSIGLAGAATGAAGRAAGRGAATGSGSTPERRKRAAATRTTTTPATTATVRPRIVRSCCMWIASALLSPLVDRTAGCRAGAAAPPIVHRRSCVCLSTYADVLAPVKADLQPRAVRSGGHMRPRHCARLASCPTVTQSRQAPRSGTGVTSPDRRARSLAGGGDPLLGTRRQTRCSCPSASAHQCAAFGAWHRRC
jgi:hypothetical protein